MGIEKKLQRRMIWIVLTLVVVAIVTWSLVPEKVPVELASVTKGPIENFLHEDGVTRVKDRFTVISPVSDVMHRLEVHAGDRVKKGETIALIVWDKSWHVKSPIDGKILKIFRDSEGFIQQGTPILEVGDTRSLEIAADVLTSDAVQIPPNAAVIIEQWGGEKPLAGKVRTVEPGAFTKISALGVEEQRVNVVIDITSPHSEWESLGDNFKVDCRILVERKDGVLKIPIGAVFRDGENWFVFKLESARAKKQVIQIGVRTQQEAEILSGLTESDRVIIYPGSTVKDGVRIRY